MFYLYHWFSCLGCSRLPPKDCPESVNLIIKNYSIDAYTITLTIQNRGNFNVEGFYVRASDNPESNFGVFQIGQEEIQLAPFDTIVRIYQTKNKNITYLELQPFRYDGKKKILCKNYNTLVNSRNI